MLVEEVFPNVVEDGADALCVARREMWCAGEGVCTTSATWAWAIVDEMITIQGRTSTIHES